MSVILRINLSTGQSWTDEPSDLFLRQYLGGALGAYYLYTESEAGIDPLGPDNVLTFTPGVLAHLAVGAFNRVAITAKSPLTGAIIDAQAGGFWGPECKMAGFDAIVIQGQAEHPVYVWIVDGEVEIRDARHLWGLDTGPAEDLIKQETGEARLRSCIIGPGGENLVRFANVVNNLRHFAGRGGLGAVMGSKNLKAVAVRSRPATKPELVDRQRTMSLLKSINQAYKEDEFFELILTPLGTPWGMWENQNRGRLPTRNFAEGVFEGASKIDHLALQKHEMTQETEGCYACLVRCKRVSGLDRDGQPRIERRYGGAEYETLGNFGPLLAIDDPVALQKANELCSRYTLDTISCGATIAWAIDCYQHGLISKQDTGGLALHWGDPGLLLQLIEMIAHREGIGDLLAEGAVRAARQFGAEAEALAAHGKGLEWPAVEPRTDLSQALAYAVSPIGADHMTTAGIDCGPEFWEMIPPPRSEGLSDQQVRVYFLQRTGGSMIDGFGICRFLVGATGLRRTLEVTEAALGWRASFWELMRAGDRRVTMFRAYNAREGFTIEQDQLPPKAFQPVQNGPEDGARLDPEEHGKAVERYYEVSGWDPETGWPRRGKLVELGLEWMLDDAIPRPFERRVIETDERNIGH
ncbi:MAG: aldehyde ferredoxin oxidoreductase family protein [Anaerolineales bacterium]|nr:aldehyde ferredoxin oxidoreductase family protein [Anaerolineales bacterium]